jgi:hypothetical protein
MLSDVLDDIEQQTDYLFIFNDRVNVSRKVSINVKTKPVSGVLDKLLASTEVQYALQGTHIMLSARDTDLGTEMRQAPKTVTGTVRDNETGESIIGANIVEKGTTNGTITDSEGRFSLSISENATLQISYIGYIMQEISDLSGGGGG